jgi:hypothetical protein
MLPMGSHDDEPRSNDPYLLQQDVGRSSVRLEEMQLIPRVMSLKKLNG